MIAGILALAAVANGGVPLEPPAVLFRRSSIGSGPLVRAALWADGRLLRSATGEASGSTYELGRLDTRTLQHVACELAAIDLWNYGQDGGLSDEPTEDLWLRRGLRSEDG